MGYIVYSSHHRQTRKTLFDIHIYVWNMIWRKLSKKNPAFLLLEDLLLHKKQIAVKVVVEYSRMKQISSKRTQLEPFHFFTLIGFYNERHEEA